MKIGKDILGIKPKEHKPKRSGDWHVIFWDLDKNDITTEVVPMEEAPTSRHAIAIAKRRLVEKGKRVHFRSVGFVDR